MKVLLRDNATETSFAIHMYMRYYKFGRPQLQPSFNHKDPGMKSRFENYCNQLGFDQMLLMVQEYAQHCCCIRGILYWRIIKGEKTQTLIYVV